MVSHELRNPLSAIVQSSDVVLKSLKGLLSLRVIPSETYHELSDDIDTMKSIGLCTMHMRRLIDDTINVLPFMVILTTGFQTRKRLAPSNPRRLRTDDHRPPNPTNLRCRTPEQENRNGNPPRRVLPRLGNRMGPCRSISNFANPYQSPIELNQVP